MRWVSVLVVPWALAGAVVGLRHPGNSVDSTCPVAVFLPCALPIQTDQEPIGRRQAQARARQGRSRSPFRRAAPRRRQPPGNRYAVPMSAAPSRSSCLLVLQRKVVSQRRLQFSRGRRRQAAGLHQRRPDQTARPLRMDLLRRSASWLVREGRPQTARPTASRPSPTPRWCARLWAEGVQLLRRHRPR